MKRDGYEDVIFFCDTKDNGIINQKESIKDVRNTLIRPLYFSGCLGMNITTWKRNEKRKRRIMERVPPNYLTPPKVEPPPRVSIFMNAEGEKELSESERSGTEGASFDSVNSSNKPTFETKLEPSPPCDLKNCFSSIFDLPGCTN